MNKEKKPLNEEEKSFYLGPFCWIILLWYRYKAFKGNGDQKIAKYYLKYVYLIKLYSRDARKQSLAIKEMVQLPDIRWTFLELVKRVGRKPRLSSDNKFLLIDEIRELSKRMGNSNIRG
ncbi:MAG: hypothetical protein FWC47_00450 [Oscillospiraceae bacterium]|nr:hypothetical protein [Oscillospiraceae bacterium]